MPPPTKLAIATGVVVRLVKEEASYHKEIEHQEARIKQSEANPPADNAEYTLRQERQALEETKKVLPGMKIKIEQAVERLEGELENNQEEDGSQSTEVTKAKEAIASAQKTLGESS